MYYTVPESSIQGERQNELQTLNLNPSLDHLDTSGEFLDKSGECPEEETVCLVEETMLREQPVLDQLDVSLNGENNQNQMEATPLQVPSNQLFSEVNSFPEP